MKIKKLALLLVAANTLVLTACNNGAAGQGQGAAKSVKPVLKAEDQTKTAFFSLGSGYIKTLQQLTSTSSVIPLEDSDPVSASSPQASISFVSASSNSSILNKLGLDGSIKGKYQEAKGEITADFLDSDKTDEQSFSYYLGYTSSVDVKLKKTGYEVDFEEDGHPDRGIYGDNYLSSLRMGMGAFLKINIVSKNKEALQVIKGSLKGSYGDFGSLKVALDKLESGVQSSVTVEVNAIQLGGEVDQLIGALGSPKDSSGEGQGIYSCSLSKEGLNSCQELLDHFEHYARNGLSSQIKTYIIDSTKNSQLTYGDIKILYPMDNTISSLNTRAVGAYYNVANPTQKNTTKGVNSDYTKALTLANTQYTNLLGKLDELLKIKSLTGGMWNQDAIETVKAEIVNTSNDILNYTKDSCMPSHVVDNEEMRSECINEVSEKSAHTQTVLDDYKNLVKDKFKGYKIFTTTADGANFEEYFLPNEDGVSFIDIITPGNLLHAKFNPYARWTINEEGNSLALDPYEITVLPDLADKQYHPSTQNPPTATLGAGKLILQGEFVRKAGDNPTRNFNNTFSLTSIAIK